MGKRGRGLSGRELPDHLADQIREHDVRGQPLTRIVLQQKCSKEWGASRDTIEKALDALIQTNKVVEVASETGKEILLHDLLRLKTSRERRLRISGSDDLFQLVRRTLIEKSARSSQYAMSVSEIHDYVQLTYMLEGNSSEHLFSGIMKAVKSMVKRDLVEEKVPLNNETKYFATASLMLHKPFNPNEPSTSSQDISVHDPRPSSSTSSVSPQLNTSTNSKHREKRLSEASQQNSDASKSELKSLQDSLSSYFTPSNSRRSRVAQSSFSLEHLPLDDCKLGVLEVEIDKDEPPKKKGPNSKNSIEGRSPASASTLSPNRHTDRLTDSLSPYFSANSDRRRRHERGEYLHLSNGVRKKGKDDPSKSVLSDLNNDEDCTERRPSIPHAESVLDSSENLVEMARLGSPGLKKRQRASELVSEEVPARPTPPSGQLGARRNSTRLTPKNRASATILKRYKNQHTRTSTAVPCAPSTSGSSIAGRKLSESTSGSRSPRKSLSSTPAASSLLKMTSPQRRTSVSPTKPAADVTSTSPRKIPQTDEDIFLKSQLQVQQRLQLHQRVMIEKGEDAVFPARIRFGRYEIEALYSSPYPSEYACLPLLYICEKCLMYMGNDKRHRAKCRVMYPPGNEIYRKDNVSVFEVDGNSARVYCRNLCLLAKLFMHHKTLYFDVEPFLFYVCTQTDDSGTHFVGYFSKEKYSHQKFNLACIVTLPVYQNKGYGRFLIDFSYLLSRRENMLGTPERPLSELGEIAYKSYWRSAIFEYLHRRKENNDVDSLSLSEMARGTGISLHDIANTMVDHGFLAEVDGQVCWRIDWTRVNDHWNKAKKDKRRIWMDEERLLWQARVYTPSIDYLTTSPLQSPARVSGHSSRKKDVRPSDRVPNGTAAHTNLFNNENIDLHQRRRQNRRFDESGRIVEVNGVLQKSGLDRGKLLGEGADFGDAAENSDTEAGGKRRGGVKNRKNCEAAVLASRKRPNQGQRGPQPGAGSASATHRLPQANKPAAKPKRRHSSPLNGVTRGLNPCRRVASSTSENSSDDEDAKSSAQRRLSANKPGRKAKSRKLRPDLSSDSESSSILSDWSRPPSRTNPIDLFRPNDSAGVIGQKKLPEEVRKAQEAAGTAKPAVVSDESDVEKPVAPRRLSVGKKGKSAGKKGGKTQKKGKGKRLDDLNSDFDGDEDDEHDETYKSGRSGKKAAGKKVGRKAGAKPQRPSPRGGKKLPRSPAKPVAEPAAPTSEASSRTASPRPSTSQNHQLVVLNETDDEANRSDLSGTPPPLGERRNRLSMVSMAVQDVVNMGGEPDTMNMGGEPDDDEEEEAEGGPHADFVVQHSPKAPKPLFAEDDYSNPEMPAPDLQHHHHHPQQQQPQPAADYRHAVDRMPLAQPLPDPPPHYNDWSAAAKRHSADLPPYQDPMQFAALSAPPGPTAATTQPQQQQQHFQPMANSGGDFGAVPPPPQATAMRAAEHPVDENEMPVLEANDDMPVLMDESQMDDDAPPPLSPKFGDSNQAAASGPPLLDSQAPVIEASNPAVVEKPHQPQALAFDKRSMSSLAVDTGAPMITKPTALPHMDSFSQPDYNSSAPGLPPHQIQPKASIHRHSPAAPQVAQLQQNSSSPANYKANSHKSSGQMFSPPGPITAPNSLPPPSQRSSSTNPDGPHNNGSAELRSPPPPPDGMAAFASAPTTNSQASNGYSPTKTRTATAKETPANATLSRRRNTTDGTSQKPAVRAADHAPPPPPQQQQQHAHHANSRPMNLADMSQLPFVSPYFNAATNQMFGATPTTYAAPAAAAMPVPYDANNMFTPPYWAAWTGYALPNANAAPNPGMPPKAAFPAALNAPGPAAVDPTVAAYYSQLQQQHQQQQQQQPPNMTPNNFANFAANAALANAPNQGYYNYG